MNRAEAKDELINALAELCDYKRRLAAAERENQRLREIVEVVASLQIAHEGDPREEYVYHDVMPSADMVRAARAALAPSPDAGKE